MTMAQEKVLPTDTKSWTSLLKAGVAWRLARSRKGHLDIRELSDHLRRDLGILDGNDPAGRHR
jgi:uncharacterized protein YjiS (DUF1127 family)